MLMFRLGSPSESRDGLLKTLFAQKDKEESFYWRNFTTYPQTILIVAQVLSRSAPWMESGSRIFYFSASAPKAKRKRDFNIC